MQSRIPKIVHYCWFGKKEKPKKIKGYIESWKRILKDYQFIEWNEENFPIDYCVYSKEAYQAGKYAFVSDVARLYALSEFGGIYFDTDIELRQSLTPYLNASMILSFESESLLMTGFFAAEKNSLHINKLLDDYKQRSFINLDGTLNMVANTVYLTEHMKQIGLQLGAKEQILDNDIQVYNYKKFGGYDADNSYFDISERTVLVHRCMASWAGRTLKMRLMIQKIFVRALGVECYKYYKLKIKIRKDKS